MGKNLFTRIDNPECVISVDQKTTIHDNVILGPKCKKIDIGFGCFIGRDVYIDVEHLEIGDYTTIHHGSLLNGYKTIIGHNCWFGHYSIIDSLGGDTRIGNNVGAGAHSQLWSHMKFGDTLAGCRWNSSGRLWLDDDVWLVGHCIVGPIHAKKRSMLMTGSVGVKDMEENCIYSGSPAINVTEKLGPQFIEKSPAAKCNEFELLKNSYKENTGRDIDNFIAVESFSDSHTTTQFDLTNRTYQPTRSDEEYEFIKFLLYDKAKFIPLTND